MGPDSQPTIDWQLISQAIAEEIIPSPSGSDENGMPYWVFQDKKITWQQIQSFIVEKRKQQSAGNNSGGGIESIPQIPVANFESGIESSVEHRVETSPERREEVVEDELEQVGDQSNTQPPKPEEEEQKGPSLIGHSAPLSTVDPSDPNSILRYVEDHKNDPADSSDKFLAEFLEKILQVLSLGDE